MHDSVHIGADVPRPPLYSYDTYFHAKTTPLHLHTALNEFVHAHLSNHKSPPPQIKKEKKFDPLVDLV